MSRTRFEFQVTCNPPCNKYTVVGVDESPNGPKFDCLDCYWCNAQIPQEELDKGMEQYFQSVFAPRQVRTV